MTKLNSPESSTNKNQGLYLYIEFFGSSEIEIDSKDFMGQHGEEKEDWQSALSSEKSPLEDLPKKFKIPDGDCYGTVIYAENGLFVPSALVDYLKVQFNVEKVSFQLIHKISKEEYEAELQYNLHKAEFANLYKQAETIVKKETKKSKHKETKLDYHVNNEIENLIGSVERGNLHVITPDADEPEFEKTPTDDDLLSGGFTFEEE